MIYLKTDEEIELVRAANMVVARTLGEVAKHIEPGVTTLKLNQVAEDFIRSQVILTRFACRSTKMWYTHFRQIMPCARATSCRLTAEP